MIGQLYPFKKRRPPEPKQRLPYTHVDLFHWRPGNGSINFGDWLSEIVTRQLLATRGFTLDDQVSQHVRLLAIGSILHYARTGDHVWGTGWNGKIPEKDFTARHLKIYAVRGPLTREFLRAKGIRAPEIYGDPALLLPYLFPQRFSPAPEKDYIFVPNLHDLTATERQHNLVSPLWGWNLVVQHILKAKLVLASSLHGLIIAEAFGIPARYVRLTPTEDLFKYRDYYFGTGRVERDFEFATSVEEGLEMGGAKSICFDHKPLVESFPFHLWE